MNIEDQISLLKTLLASAEDDYSHAIARGDWDACSTAKAQVAKYRNRIGKAIKQRMALA